VRREGTVLGAVVALAAAGLLLSGCAGDGIDAVPAAAQLPATAAPDAVPSAAEPTEAEPTTSTPAGATPTSSAPRTAVALSAARTWSGTATYDLRARGGATGTVTVTRSGDRVRVDVATGGTTSSVMTADAGWVACLQGDEPTCVTVAAPGAALPAAWDPGVGGLLTSVVPGLGERERGFYPDGYLVAGAAGDAAACFEVVAPDTGRYCVTEAGLLRRAKFTGGTLSLTAAEPTAAVDPARFRPPVAPTTIG